MRIIFWFFFNAHDVKVPCFRYKFHEHWKKLILSCHPLLILFTSFLPSPWHFLWQPWSSCSSTKAYAHIQRQETKKVIEQAENILATKVSIFAISVLFPLSLACQEYHWRCSETFMMTQWRIRRPGHLTMCRFPMIFCLNSFPSS